MFTTKTASARCYNTLLLIGGAILLSAGCAPGAGGGVERQRRPGAHGLPGPGGARRHRPAPEQGGLRERRAGDDGVPRARPHGGRRQPGQVQSFATPQGLVPANLQAAYSIPVGGTHGTVAIIDAQDDPNAEADLAVYRQQFGLPGLHHGQPAASPR